LSESTNISAKLAGVENNRSIVRPTDASAPRVSLEASIGRMHECLVGSSSQLRGSICTHHDDVRGTHGNLLAVRNGNIGTAAALPAMQSSELPRRIEPDGRQSRHDWSEHGDP